MKNSMHVEVLGGQWMLLSVSRTSGLSFEPLAVTGTRLGNQYQPECFTYAPFVTGILREPVGRRMADTAVGRARAGAGRRPACALLPPLHVFSRSCRRVRRAAVPIAAVRNRRQRDREYAARTAPASSADNGCRVWRCPVADRKSAPQVKQSFIFSFSSLRYMHGRVHRGPSDAERERRPDPHGAPQPSPRRPLDNVS